MKVPNGQYTKGKEIAEYAVQELGKIGIKLTLNLQELITTRAKRLDDRRIVYGHAMRNVLIPLVTVPGLCPRGNVDRGSFGGYFGGWFDTVTMRLADVQLAIPSILLAISSIAFAGRSLGVLLVVLSLAAWIVFARTIRGVTLGIKAAAFIVLGTQQVALLIILESSLSFIGARVPTDQPSWGTMVADGRDYILTRASRSCCRSCRSTSSATVSATSSTRGSGWTDADN